MNINKFRVREYFQTAELAKKASELRPTVMMYALDTKEIYVNGKPLGNDAPIPTKTSQLTNDSGFTTATEVASSISTAITNKQNKMTVQTVDASGNYGASVNDAVSNTMYVCTGDARYFGITLPANPDAMDCIMVHVTFGSEGVQPGSGPYITVQGNGHTVSYMEGFEVKASTSYELNFLFDGTEWTMAYGIIG